jgi:alpha-tubulin suppressor-like RCC1 family protein
MRAAPVRVEGLEGIVEVDASAGSHTCARDGVRVWCWGWNMHGQLGDGTTTDRPTPSIVVGFP